MRDLIRHYAMLLKRRKSDDSGTESQPLLSSQSSITSFGTGNLCMFNDSETTDYEREKTPTPPTDLTVSPQRTSIQRPFSYTDFDGTIVDVSAFDKEKHPYLSQFAHFSGILDASQSLIQTKESFVEIELPKTQSSLVTIFAIWNTIMGTSLLAMPWGMERAGLFPGIVVNTLVAALCLYTCYLILRVNEDHGVIGHHNEVSDLARILLGKWAEFIAKVFSLIVLIGSNIVYWVLMSNFLYHSVRVIYGYVLSLSQLPNNATVICPQQDILNNLTVPEIQDSKVARFDQVWDLYSTTPIILAIFMFPLLNFKSPTFFTKFNSLGTLSVLYLLTFVAVKSITWGINMDSWVIEFNIKSTFCALSGMLSLSYFIHNIIISIMRSNRNPKNNTRDLSIAFLLVTFTYTFIGVLFYICFPLAKNCIEDNILNNFEKHDHMTILARLLLLFQLFTVFPLVSFMLRNDVLKNISAYTNTLNEFSYWKVIAVNIVMVTVCILFACFLPKIGTLVRYTGALSGLVYIFLLPSLMKIASLVKKEELTPIKFVIYILIAIFGFLNLISQFFIIDK